LDWVQFIIEGFPVGCVYALVAVGLVLTYKTSGVFNLAFGAQAYASAAVFYDLSTKKGWPLLAAFAVAVFVVGPLIGLLLDRLLFRYMRTASWMVKLASSLGLLVAIPAIVDVFYGSGPKFSPRNLGPLFGFDSTYVWRFSEYNVPIDKLVTVAFTIVIVVALGLMFRYTALGLQMRAVVESPRMVELAGVDSERVSMTAWILSSFLAGLAGVLLAPLFNSVIAGNYTILIVAAAAAAAFGRLTSIPLTLVGGLLLGIGQRVISGYLPLDSVFAEGIRPALPFLLLFLLLIFLPALYKKRDVGDPLQGVDPPPPAVAAEYKDEQLRKVTKITFPIFIAGFIFLNLFVLSDLWVFRLTSGLVLAIIFMSITVFTGLSGQVSLGQAAFAGIGAALTGQLASQAGLNVVVAMLIGAVVAGIVGGLLAIPALRLGGIFLAIATLAFALAVQSIVFPLDGRDEIFGFHPNVFGGSIGVDVPRPGGLADDQAFFLFVFAIFGIVATLVILVRNGATGRFLAAMRGSETAAASIGINATKSRIIVFAFSAAVAGLGGGLYGMLNRGTSAADWLALLGVAWVVLVLTLGVRTIDGAVNAGMTFVISGWLLTEALNLPFEIFYILFGYGAITYARHPEGIVDFQTRRSIEGQVRARKINARAKELLAQGASLPGFRATITVIAPLLLVLAFPVYDYYFGWSLPAFIILVGPPVVWVLWWAVRVGADLWAHSGAPRWKGPLALAIGAVVGAIGAVTGFGIEDEPLGLSTGRAVFVGVVGGLFVVAVFLLPLALTRRAVADGRDSPMTWHASRAPAGFAIVGAYIWYRTTLPTPPTELGLLFVSLAALIVVLQWVSSAQSALNEYALPLEEVEEPVLVGEARKVSVPAAPVGSAE
jgi:branched-subunit amino acid ABC-type transport system permease component